MEKIFRIAAGLLLALFSIGHAHSSHPAALPAGPTRGPELVKDIQTMNAWSLPNSFISLSDAFYFSANDGLHGSELWRSEGTPETTQMVADLRPGPEGSSPFLLTPLDDTHLVFVAYDANDKQQIWVSDGTALGTQQLTGENDIDFNLYSQVSATLDGVVYLVEGSIADSYRLWRTDGTQNGTAQATDLLLSNNNLAAFDGWLYFAGIGAQGKELYRINASSSAAELVKDLCTGECGRGLGNASPSGMVAAAGRLYFAASDDAHGRALWSTTGAAGSDFTLVADLIAETNPLEGYGSLTPAGDGLYFVGNDGVSGSELWYTGGAPASTHQLADLALGPDDGGYNEMVLLGNRLFFTARPVFPGYYDLYATTGSGVQKLSGSLKSAGNLTRVGSTIYFEGSTFSGNTELWKVTEDGVPERVASILPMQFYVIDKGAWNNQLFFSAGDPVHGYELWISDGSQAGTKMLADLNTQTLPSGADIYGLTAVYKGAVYFGASSGFDYNGLWRSDGTAAGTEQVDTIHSRPIWEGMQDSAVSNDFLYYTGVNRADGNIGLWRTDGTSEGTVELMDNTWPHRFMDANGRLFFISQNEVSLNMGLWVLNKGETIPTMVMETNATQLGALGSDCLLVAWVDNGWELWRTDGTSGGTYLIDAKTSSWSFSQDYLFNQLEEMVSFDGRLFFIAPSEGISDTAALYATDGSTITQISAAQATPLFPTQPVVAGNSLYFGGMNGQDSVIWKLTAGSDEATVIHTAATGLESYSEYRVPIPLTNLNGKLVFRSDPQEENGDLLWLSDGTSQGTAPICPDCSYRVCSCEAPVVANGKMYFAASDTQSLQGNELWVSDGSAAGTKLLADILPGPGSSDPANLIVLGQKLLFTATDGTEAGTDHGYELWRYDLDPIYTFLPLIRR